MIKLLGKVPRTITLAVSGGVDSMVMLDFLSKRHQVEVAFFNHDTQTSHMAEQFLEKQCAQRGIVLNRSKLSEAKPNDLSHEEFWRIERYKFLDKFECVATAHTLDDVAETWVWGCLNGVPKLIPYSRNNVIRPFLTTSKSELINWATRKNVEWIEDASNRDVKYTRNYIRHELMPHALKVNPGLHSMLKKRLLAKYVEL